MRIFKSHPFLKLVNAYVIDHSQPTNISYMWNFGSLLGVCLVVQIITGVTLAMHYNPSVAEAFNSIEHIMRDVNNGWLVRYLHSNTASAFFFLVYLHIGRGIYYGSYRAPRTLGWVIGTIIFIVMVVTAFLGFKKYSPKWINNINLLASGWSTKNMNFRSQKRYLSTLKSTLHDKDSKVVLDFIQDKKLKPVFIYEDLKDQSTKDKIKNQTKELSGIYLILNKKTLDFYVGSGSTNKIYTRFYRHLISLTGSKIVKLAVKKYGLYNFAFLILETSTEITTVENNKNLLDIEDFYLKSLLPNYNILTEAGSCFGYKHTELDRIKMKSNYSYERLGFVDKKREILNKNKEFSPLILERRGKSDLNRDKLYYSIEELNNMKKASKPIILYNIENNTVYGEYNSIVECAFNLNCRERTIYRALKTEKKILLKRWIVKFTA